MPDLPAPASGEPDWLANARDLVTRFTGHRKVPVKLTIHHVPGQELRVSVSVGLDGGGLDPPAGAGVYGTSPFEEQVIRLFLEQSGPLDEIREALEDPEADEFHSCILQGKTIAKHLGMPRPDGTLRALLHNMCERRPPLLRSSHLGYQLVISKSRLKTLLEG